MTRYTRIIAARKARPYEVETYADMAYWVDGALVCQGCDYHIIDAQCERCEIQFIGEPPAEPVQTYSDRRQAWHDSHSVPAEDVVRLILRDMNSPVIL